MGEPTGAGRRAATAAPTALAAPCAPTAPVVSATAAPAAQPPSAPGPHAVGPHAVPATRPPAPTGTALLRDVTLTVRGRLAAMTGVMLVNTGTDLAAPALLAAAVDGVLHGTTAVRAVAAWAAVVALGMATEVAVPVLGTSAGFRAVRRLRMTTVRHLIGLGGRSVQGEGTGVTHVVQAAQQAGALSVALAQMSVTLLGSLAALVALWVTDWRSALAFSLAAPLSVLFAARFMGRVAGAQSDYLAAQSRIADRLLAALSGARTIRAADALDLETDRVLRPLAQVSAAGRRMWGLQRGAVWQFGLLMALTETLTLAVAGLGVADGRLAPGELLAVAGYLRLASSAVEQIDGLLGLAQSRAAADRVATALAQPLVAYGHFGDQEPSSTAGPHRAGALTLRAVTVRQDDAVLLDRVDLEIPAGASVALVGRTGAGKSLLAGLPGRFTEPDEGEVLIDGVPVGDLTAEALRRTVTYAFARPALIGATLHDVLTYGRPDVSRAEAEAAARAARADAYIRRLPDGYDTATDAAPMSGGERQRLGLARTLARPARLYVLDDATSGLDTVTEAEVGQAVTGALAGRTRLVVTHRATTAARCDLTAWLDNGRIRMVAPHAALWKDPAYRAVFAAAPETGKSDDPRRVKEPQ